MKKRVFIAIHYLEIGGVEMSLIGLLQALDYSKYDVDLFVYNHRGELMRFIPKKVNLLPEVPEYAQIDRPIREVIHNGYYRIACRRLLGKLNSRLYNKIHSLQGSITVFQYVFNAVVPILPQISPETGYDLAVSFLIPHNVVRDKVRAKKKIAWIHTDYSKVSVNANLELPVWASYDKVVSISDQVSSNFLRVFPSLSKKIVRIDNILSASFVRERASLLSPSLVDKEMPRVLGRINILSVGRFVEAKNYDNVPDICKRIRDLGLDVCWYLIGYGGAETLIRSRINEAGVEDYVIILGKKDNPYPYIKACDFYAQPSRYEGNSVTVREAQILCKPVIITRYPTAESQVKNGIDGVIIPLENELCAKGIYDFICDHEKQDRIKDYLYSSDYGNESEVEKFCAMI